MTVVSLVLIVGAVVLLGYGLLEGSNLYLVASILTSLIAALALVIGSRRSGRAAVAAAIEQEEAARNTRRRVRQDRLVGAGVGGGTAGRTGERVPPSDEYTDHDDLARGATHETTLMDVGRRGGVRPRRRVSAPTRPSTTPTTTMTTTRSSRTTRPTSRRRSGSPTPRPRASPSSTTTSW